MKKLFMILLLSTASTAAFGMHNQDMAIEPEPMQEHQHEVNYCVTRLNNFMLTLNLYRNSNNLTQEKLNELKRNLVQDINSRAFLSQYFIHKKYPLVRKSFIRSYNLDIGPLN